ncbi:MAG TPA: phosphoribosyl-AMP cyclohydrolase [Terriglobia bacterium]|jgi:phosphoribosyl-AMP cyclohydrolase|nr:phosphoribosyl-AMP cyclohydrolase [Terriglobia bacterium]
MDLKFQDGLVPAIVQDRNTGDVLMLGYMNQQAYQMTLDTGYVTFYSRSRQKLWTKGETSGHKLRVHEVRVDCDKDALLIRAELAGPGCCHMGYRSCFFRKVTPQGEEVIAQREFNPDAVYSSLKQETQL